MSELGTTNYDRFRERRLLHGLPSCVSHESENKLRSNARLSKTAVHPSIMGKHKLMHALYSLSYKLITTLQE